MLFIVSHFILSLCRYFFFYLKIACKQIVVLVDLLIIQIGFSSLQLVLKSKLLVIFTEEEKKEKMAIKTGSWYWRQFLSSIGYRVLNFLIWQAKQSVQIRNTSVLYNCCVLCKGPEELISSKLKSIYKCEVLSSLNRSDDCIQCHHLQMQVLLSNWISCNNLKLLLGGVVVYGVS